MEEETKFHWAEGMKYALEGIKILFLLNGVAVLSILTFIGNSKNNSDQLIYAMFCFAFGAATGPISLFLAYMTQLEYGNSAMQGPHSRSNLDNAKKLHHKVYIPIIIGLVFFLLGILLAGYALRKL